MTLIDARVTAITPFIFVTAAQTVHQRPELLRLHRIDCLINLAEELPQLDFRPTSCKYPIVDEPNFPVWTYFDRVTDCMAAQVNANRRILLYCHFGQSRSITFILAYLIKYHQLTLQNAFLLVRLKRVTASPNPGFWKQLKIFEGRQKFPSRPTIKLFFQELFGDD